MINSAPYKIDNDWSHLLNSCPLRDTEERVQAHDLITYVNLLIDTALKYPSDYVIKYGIKRLLKFKIHEDNWSLLEALVLKLGSYEPSVLPTIYLFLEQNRALVSAKRLTNFISTMLQQCISRGHNFEVSWSLWIAKQFAIKIRVEDAQEIIDSRDVISMMILLDMREELLILSGEKLDLTELELDFTEDNLTTELWLLIYEANRKKWIKSKAVSSSAYFSKLEELKISFYDSDITIVHGDSNVLSDKELSDDKAEALAEFLALIDDEDNATGTTPRKKKRKVKIEASY